MLGYITEVIPQDMIINTLEEKENFFKDSLHYDKIVNFLVEGFALHQILLDDTGIPYDFKFIKVNHSFQRLTNIKSKDILNKSFKSIFPGCIDLWINIFSRVALDGKIISYETYSYKIKKYFKILAFSPKKGKFITLFSEFIPDQSNHKTSCKNNIKKENNWKFMAYHDPLTALPNRRLLVHHLNREFILQEKQNSTFAIMFIDIDNFKIINDTLGHHAGDCILKEFSNRLKSIIKYNDKVFRLGGDEFVLFIKINTGLDTIITTIKKLTRSLHIPFKFENKEIFLTLSVGISLYPEDGKDIDSLLKNADTAMYKAKEQCGICFKFYNYLLAQSYLNMINKKAVD
ncbi:GGDEF domain-containing protein [Clostridium rectalis]|uniref:GGDEF domain-containing protein n=1 Tax=Clostridium rectalis TaxID=2040295 RepID=UPI000F63A508|nr:GGDEF domain-containing protein [Clostridium rectalis]